MNVKHPSSPVTQATRDSEMTDKPDPLRGLSRAAYLLIAFAVGRVLNIVPVLSSLPLVKILVVYIFFALIARWQTLPKLVTPANPVAKWWIAFVVWIALSITYSTWLGPSRDFILLQLPVLCTLVLVIYKLSVNWESLRNLFFALFVAALVLVIASMRTYGGGRLDVEALGDTNELAYMFDGVIPIAMAFGMTAASRKHRLLFYGSVAIMALAVALTGSRGGMFGLLAVIIYMMLAPAALKLRAHRAAKLAKAPKRRMGVVGRVVIWAAVFTLVGAVVWPHLPQEPRERLASMLTLGSDYNMTDQEGRVQIWKRGLKAFSERPIGYGIASYPMVDWRHGGLFYTAHNSLILLLVELGPVGLLMYLGMLLRLWRGLANARRTLSQLEAPSAQHKQQAIFARMSQASLVGTFVAGEFLSATYYYGHWATLALGMALIALVNREKSESSSEPNRALNARSIGRGGDVGHRPDKAPDDVRRPRPPRRRRPTGSRPVAGDYRAR
jgi:O-antigen ligase